MRPFAIHFKFSQLNPSQAAIQSKRPIPYHQVLHVETVLQQKENFQLKKKKPLSTRPSKHSAISEYTFIQERTGNTLKERKGLPTIFLQSVSIEKDRPFLGKLISKPRQVSPKRNRPINWFHRLINVHLK